MTTSAEFKQVIKAIHNVQQNVEAIGKTSTAGKGTYTYKYADMTSIWNAIKGELKTNGLTIIQSPTSGNGAMMGDNLTTTIFHDSGEWVQDTMRLIVTKEDPQGVGAAITYARRYMLTALFGLVTDDDNDAATQRLADGNMKQEWVRAFVVVTKRIDPAANPTNNDFTKFMTETYGKHPTRVLAKEHKAVLDTINAFDPGNEVQDSK